MPKGHTDNKSFTFVERRISVRIDAYVNTAVALRVVNFLTRKMNVPYT